MFRKLLNAAITIIITIMTQALTGDMASSILGPYQAFVKGLIIQSADRFDLNTIMSSFEDAFDTSLLLDLTTKLSADLQTMLGPMDEVLGLFNIVQGLIDFPGIIRDLMNLIGPNLLYTILSELFQNIISLAFEALSETWNSADIDSFLNISNVDSFLLQMKQEFIDIAVSELPSLSEVTTISGLVKQIGKLASLINPTIFGSLLSLFVSDLKNSIQNNIIVRSIIDLISTLIGGFLYLISPVMTFTSVSSSPTLSIKTLNTNNNNLMIQSNLIEKIAHIAIFFFLSLITRVINGFLIVLDFPPRLQLTLKSIELILSILNWGYTAGFSIPFFSSLNIPELPGTLTSIYGDEFGYLGSNGFSIVLNTIGDLLELSVIYFKTRDPQNDFPHENVFHMIASAVKAVAGAVTVFAAGAYGPHCAIAHFLDQNPVVVGDISFIVQAGFMYIVLNLDDMQHAINKIEKSKGNPNAKDYGLINWKNYFCKEGKVDKMKKANFILMINLILDATMASTFIILA